jgi:AraC-like DNA-binding protein
MPSVTVANITPNAILKLCAERGVSSERLLSASRIQKGEITSFDARISAEHAFTLWEEAQKLTGDGMIAEHTTSYLPFGAFRLLDYLLATSSTAREGLTALVKNFRLVNCAFDLELTFKSGRSKLELHSPFDAQGPARLYVEFVFAAVQSRLRLASGSSWHPLQVRFAHDAPRNVCDYRRVFQCPVLFNEPVNQMLIEDQLLDISFPGADPALSELLGHQAELLLKSLPIQDGFLSDLRRALGEGLSRGDVRIKTTAKRLAVSSRALQRELLIQGTSYREVLDRLRCELAVGRLRRNRLEIEEISRFLGFSDSRSFYRAFKRWTGKTPQEYLQHPSETPSNVKPS